MAMVAPPLPVTCGVRDGVADARLEDLQVVISYTRNTWCNDFKITLHGREKAFSRFTQNQLSDARLRFFLWPSRISHHMSAIKNNMFSSIRGRFFFFHTT